MASPLQVYFTTNRGILQKTKYMSQSAVWLMFDIQWCHMLQIQWLISWQVIGLGTETTHQLVLVVNDDFSNLTL